VIRERGAAGTLEDGATAYVTVHPSYLLRIPDHAGKRAAYGDFVGDLKSAYALAMAGRG
jgi:DNA polymerase